jgi:hypothetical protein
MLMVVNVTAAMFRDMITYNPIEANNTSEGYNIWIWKLKLKL